MVLLQVLLAKITHFVDFLQLLGIFTSNTLGYNGQVHLAAFSASPIIEKVAINRHGLLGVIVLLVKKLILGPTLCI